MPRSQRFADVVPEVGVDGRSPFDLLRGAGDVDRRGEQFPLAVPEEQHLDALILRTFDAAEVRPIGGAVHLGPAVGIDRSPVLGHHGMSKSPADPTRLARFPGLDCGLGDPRREELRILRRLHDAVPGDLVIPFLHDGRRVRVRGVEQQFPDIQAGNPVLDPPANLLEDRVIDRHQVTRDQHSLIEHLVAVPGFQGQRRCHHRTLHVPGDPGMHLTRERNRPIGRDADSRTPHVQFGAPALDECGGDRKGGEGQDRTR